MLKNHRIQYHRFILAHGTCADILENSHHIPHTSRTAGTAVPTQSSPCPPWLIFHRETRDKLLPRHGFDMIGGADPKLIALFSRHVDAVAGAVG